MKESRDSHTEACVSPDSLPGGRDLEALNSHGHSGT